ncbi:hypothetical protein MMC21_006418 [Puttea exsequens]|nr:hypothetical protein [Puttea exsequens]
MLFQYLENKKGEFVDVPGDFPIISVIKRVKHKLAHFQSRRKAKKEGKLRAINGEEHELEESANRGILDEANATLSTGCELAVEQNVPMKRLDAGQPLTARTKGPLKRMGSEEISLTRGVQVTGVTPVDTIEPLNGVDPDKFEVMAGVERLGAAAVTANQTSKPSGPAVLPAFPTGPCHYGTPLCEGLFEVNPAGVGSSADFDRSRRTSVDSITRCPRLSVTTQTTTQASTPPSVSPIVNQEETEKGKGEEDGSPKGYKRLVEWASRKREMVDWSEVKVGKSEPL